MARLQHVTVTAPSEELLPHLQEFYEALGGRSEERPPRLAADTPGRWIRFGDTQVHLILGDPVSRPAHFALELGDDYHFARAKIERMGSQISEARDLWGSPRCFVQDPAGNLVELFEFGPSQ